MPDVPLLSVEDLRVTFLTETGGFDAVDGVSFAIAEGETLGLVGESGCGKSATAMAIMGLIPKTSGRISSGAVRYQGEDLVIKTERQLEKVRGNQISMIFQEPMTSLNPVLTIGYQIIEAIQLHQGISGRPARKRAIEMLDLVGISEPDRRLASYPHQLSGGMRQRVMIAIALSCNPRLLIADEPTTALDVTIQAQILDLLKDLQRQTGMAVLLITHDLGVVAEQVDRVVVMYAGRIVEEGGPTTLFEEPRHPYTIGLLNSVPHDGTVGGHLKTIPGMVPHPSRWLSGCRFRDRCEFAAAKCEASAPELVLAQAGHRIACHFPRTGGA